MRPWGSQPEMIKIGKLRMHARLLPLLFKDVEVQHIDLEGVDVFLETDPGGRGNWNLITADSSDKRARSFKPSQIEIDTIRIENLSLTYRDGKTGSASQLTLISFGATRQDTADMLAIDLRAEYNGQPVTLSGKTGLSRDLLAHTNAFPLNCRESSRMQPSRSTGRSTMSSTLPVSISRPKPQAKTSQNSSLMRISGYRRRAHLMYQDT